MTISRYRELSESEKKEWQALCRFMVKTNFFIGLAIMACVSLYYRLSPPEEVGLHMMLSMQDTMLKAMPAILFGLAYGGLVLLVTKIKAAKFPPFYSDVIFFREMIAFAFGMAIVGALHLGYSKYLLSTLT